MGIMLRSSGAKYNSYQLTCESTVIQPGNVERLFVGGELHVLAWSEEPTVAASSGSFVPMLAVSDNLQNYIQEGPPLLLLDILAVHALARGDQQKEDCQQYVPFPLHLHGFTVWEHKQMFTLEKKKTFQVFIIHQDFKIMCQVFHTVQADATTQMHKTTKRISQRKHALSKSGFSSIYVTQQARSHAWLRKKIKWKVIKTLYLPV